MIHLRKLSKNLSDQRLCGIWLLTVVIVGEATGFLKHDPNSLMLYIYPILLTMIGAYWICGSLVKATFFLASLYGVLMALLFALPFLSIWISTPETVVHILSYLIAFSLLTVLISGVVTLMFGLWNWAFSSSGQTIKEIAQPEGIEL